MKKWIIGILATILVLAGILVVVEKNRRDEAAAQEKIMNTYKKAEEYWLAGDTQNAYLTFAEIQNHADVYEKMRQLEEQDPRLSFLLANIGDTVVLGHYEQDNNVANGSELIEWTVLYKNGESMYLLSKNILDVKAFNDENIYDCSLDKWLKSDFLKAAFNETEQKAVSRVGLLNKKDIDQYNVSNAMLATSFTQSALAKNPSTYHDSKQNSRLVWWLTTEALKYDKVSKKVITPCAYETGEDYEATIINSKTYHIDIYSDITERHGVRPAIWVFTEPDDLPKEPEFSGEAPTQSRPSGGTSGGATGGNKCSRCSGTGRVTQHFGNSWNDIPGYGYGDVCGACGGKGYT